MTRGPAEARPLGSGGLAILALRALMETGVVGGLAYWGVVTGDTVGSSVLLGVGAPAVGFGIWGALDFRRAGRFAEPLRLLEELAISGLAAAALYSTGRHVLGLALAGISGAYHIAVYTSGARRLADERSGSNAERSARRSSA